MLFAVVPDSIDMIVTRYKARIVS